MIPETPKEVADVPFRIEFPDTDNVPELIDPAERLETVALLTEAFETIRLVIVALDISIFDIVEFKTDKFVIDAPVANNVFDDNAVNEPEFPAKLF